MEIAGFEGIVDRMDCTTIVDEFVVDSHVVVKEIELSITGLLHVHLRHPVVGKIQGNVTTMRSTSMQLPRMNLNQIPTWYTGWFAILQRWSPC